MQPDSKEESILLADDENDLTSDLETLIQRRHSPKRRFIQVGMTGIALLAIIGILLIANPRMLTFLSPPTTATNTVPFAQSVTIIGSINYGTLTISSPGHKTRVEAYDAFRRDSTAGIYAGLNRFTLDAPPFGRYSCELNWPRKAADTCRVYAKSNNTIIVDLSLGLDNMPPNVRDAALATITNTLDTANAQLQTTVSAGQYIANGRDHLTGLPSYQVAATALTAALVLSPAPQEISDQADNCTIGQYICPTFPATQILQQAWGVLVLTQMQWQFTDATGTIIATTPTQGRPLFLNLTYAQGNWQVIFTNDAIPTTSSPEQFDGKPYDDAITTSCDGAIALIGPHLAPIDGATGTFQGDVTYVGRPNLAGCALRFQVQTTNNYGEQRGTYIVHFGVIYAGDATAHSYLPQLPVASSALITASEQ